MFQSNVSKIDGTASDIKSNQATFAEISSVLDEKENSDKQSVDDTMKAVAPEKTEKKEDTSDESLTSVERSLDDEMQIAQKTPCTRGQKVKKEDAKKVEQDEPVCII